MVTKPINRNAVAAILEPRSIAVLGASRDPHKRGFQAINTLQTEGFPGSIYPVNPGEEEILGLHCWASVAEINRPIDLALITTPGPIATQLLHECAAAGVRGAVIVAAGFAESDGHGQRLQEKLISASESDGIRFVGPNTNGVYNASNGLNLVGAPDIPAGSIAVLSQSGNIFLTIMLEAQRLTHVGFSFYVGIGNEADLGFADFLTFASDDASTSCVLVYAEGFKDGRAVLEAARIAAAKKPLVALKSGRTEIGKVAVRSHSAALAGAAEVWDSALSQAGIYVVPRLDMLLPVADALATSPVFKEPGVAIVSDGGGPATLAADRLDAMGLEVPELSEQTRSELARVLPPAAALRNPIDVAGAADASPAVLADVLEIVARDHSASAILVAGIFGGYAERFSADLEKPESEAGCRFGKIREYSGKPIIVQSAYAGNNTTPLKKLRAASVPVHASVDVAVTCLEALYRRGQYLATYEARSDLRLVRSRAPNNGRARLLSEPTARKLLESHGIDTGAWTLAASDRDAGQAAVDFDCPVALKIASADVEHKSDSGGVHLGIRSADQARTSYRAILRDVAASAPTAQLEGVLVVPMAEEGVELFVGVHGDPALGPVIAVGLGGRNVEALKAVSFRALPLSRLEAAEMLATSPTNELLNGWRGGPAADREALVDLLMAVSALVLGDPLIDQLDLNPVIAHAEGFDLVDVRIALTGDTN
jgi:acetyltransferase